MKNRSRSLSLLCPTCGGAEFELDDNQPSLPVRCTGCSRQMSRDELAQANGELVATQLDEMKNEAGKEIKAELTKMFTDAFRGSKYLKVKVR